MFANKVLANKLVVVMDTYSQVLYTGELALVHLMLWPKPSIDQQCSCSCSLKPSSCSLKPSCPSWHGCRGGGWSNILDLFGHAARIWHPAQMLMGITSQRKNTSIPHPTTAPFALVLLTCLYLVQTTLVGNSNYACIVGLGQAPCGGAVVPLCLQSSLYAMGHCIEATSIPFKIPFN